MDASDILPPKLPNKLGFDTVHKTHGLWQGCDYDQLTTEPGNLIHDCEARYKFSDSASGSTQSKNISRWTSIRTLEVRGREGGVGDLPVEWLPP